MADEAGEELPTSAKHLVEALHSRNADVRDAATLALEQSSNADVTVALIDALGSDRSRGDRRLG